MAFYKGDLPTIIGMKVATTPGKDGHSRVICVYTKNFLDKEDVMNVHAQLRHLGCTETIYYKPDIYTTYGIYASNKYGIKPCYYSSRDAKEESIEFQI